MIVEILLLLILLVGGLAYYYHYHYNKDDHDEEEDDESSSSPPPPAAPRSTANVRVSPMPVLEPAPEPLPPMAAPVAEMNRLLPSHIRNAIHYASKEAPCESKDFLKRSRASSERSVAIACSPTGLQMRTLTKHKYHHQIF